MATLNPSARPFVPTSSPVAIPSASDAAWGLPDDAYPEWAAGSATTEMSVSPAELEELEEVEGWVNLMAELEGMEQDHLIELSLRHADKSKVAQIKAAALAKAKAKAHHRHKQHAHAAHHKH